MATGALQCSLDTRIAGCCRASWLCGARRGAHAIDAQGQAGAAERLRRARGEPLTILWDVRNCSIPSRAQIKIALDWIGANSHLLDKHLQGIAVCLSSLIVRSILNFILSITKPPQPNGVFADEAEAFGFARDKCTEVREWVGRKKKKQLEAAAGQADSPDGTKPRGSPRLLSLGRQNSKKSNASGDSESSP